MIQDKELHYLDNAATTRVAPEVADAIHKAMTQFWGNASSLYQPGERSEQALSAARAEVAKTLGCKAEEVYFTGCGSEGNNIALLGAVAARKGWGSRIVVTGFEHPSVDKPLRRLAQEGFDVRFVAPGPDGRVPVEEMLALVNKNTILVACMKVNNEIGTVMDIERLAREVKAINSRTAVHVDAVQAWLRLPVSLTGVDSMTVSGHKIHAPKGVGALYLRKTYHIEPPFLGGGQEKGIRPGTENLPYAVGLAVAARRLAANYKERHAHITVLNQRLRAGLAALPDVTINSPEDAVPEVLNFSLNVVKSEPMLHFLEERKVYISSGSACSKGAASHTLTAMGAPQRKIDTAIRASFCAENTPEDVDALLNGLEDGFKALTHI
ncbi:MAG: cysteine desulfurase [Oscillospiraceae bacterium]|nr:cysteine desulfurase [Oscillospiraceae bacterium]